jgi:hypothetical protein
VLLGRRPMPTNVIPFAGIPAPRQFINTSPHSPNAGMEQRKTHVRRGRVQFFAFVEIVISPSAGGGYGGCAGANDRPNDRRTSLSHAATEGPCGSVVGRLLDTFDEDASGVSALQHFTRSYCRPFFVTTECLSAALAPALTAEWAWTPS